MAGNSKRSFWVTGGPPPVRPLWKPMADHLPFSGNNFVGFLSARGAR
jgi:hypothetical protein